MTQSTQARVLRRVGVSSAAAVKVLASGIGVANASILQLRPVNPSTTNQAKDANTNAPPPMPFGGPGVSSGLDDIGGEVTALSSSSLTIVSLNGTQSTYGINPSPFVTDLRPSGTESSLGVGDNVRIVVSSSDSSIATFIDIVPANIAGRVSALSDDTITVSGPNGITGTIQVSASTTYSKNRSSATLGDVSVGTFIFAEGTFGSSPTTIDAATVGIRAPHPGNGPVSGHDAGPGPTGIGTYWHAPPGMRSDIGPRMRGAVAK